MDRRSFFRGAVALPTLLAGALPALAATGRITRVSCEKGDPGEIPYGKLCADEIKPHVFLDGVEQKEAITADTVEGFVKRHITSEKGNIAFNIVSGKLLTEIVYGRVEIRLVPTAHRYAKTPFALA